MGGECSHQTKGSQAEARQLPTKEEERRRPAAPDSVFHRVVPDDREIPEYCGHYNNKPPFARELV